MTKLKWWIMHRFIWVMGKSVVGMDSQPGRISIHLGWEKPQWETIVYK